MNPPASPPGPYPSHGEDWLRARARSTPHRPAWVTSRGMVTFAQWDARVQQAAQGLWALGVRPGMRVAFWRLPPEDTLVLLWAVARVGGVLVPLHARWTEAELHRALRLVSPVWLVVHEGQSGVGGEGAHVLAWEQVLGLGREARLPALQFRSGLQGVVFTSGSTGEPKAAVLSWRNHFWNAWASAARLGLHQQDAWWLGLPLYHVGGLAVVWRAVLHGLPLVLPASFRGFDPHALTAPEYSRRPTLVSLVPTMLFRVLEAGIQPWPELRVVLLGGARAVPSLLQEALDRGWPLALTYGLTETASQVATATPDLVRRKPGTVGPPLLFTQVDISQTSSRPGVPHPVGEIRVQGPTVFHGYWGNQAATDRALRSGWLWTGDEGYLDEEGHLWVLGRRAWVINTGGEKVHPQEVEAVLLRHPAVRQVCVVGVEHPEWGQQVAAAVVVQSERTVTPQELERFCRRFLAGYKIPRRWKLVPQLPLTASGKVDRRRVQGWFSS